MSGIGRAGIDGAISIQGNEADLAWQAVASSGKQCGKQGRAVCEVATGDRQVKLCWGSGELDDTGQPSAKMGLPGPTAGARPPLKHLWRVLSNH
jgi:hypothetical protein